MYVKSTVRESILSQILKELLETRIMLKHVMKSCKNDEVRRQAVIFLSFQLDELARYMSFNITLYHLTFKPCGWGLETTENA